jgi:ATP-dependent Clp protease ATP-binding subunit ClpC
MAQNLFSEKFTSHLKQVLQHAGVLASALARELNIDAAKASNTKQIYKEQQKPIIHIAHILNALEKETGSIGAELIKKARTSEAQKIESRVLTAKNIETDVPISLSTKAANAIVKSVQISHTYGHRYIGTEHLAKSIVAADSQESRQWFAERGISTTELEKSINVVLESTSKFPDLTAVFRPESSGEAKKERRQTALLYFGKELTGVTAQKDIDPLIGRELEIERVIQVLSRRYKNNPLLLGEAGVGKTAIVEGLASRIAEGNVPPTLANKKIYTIDLGAMVAGTMYRGEFEARLKQSLEVAEKERNVILFIDEIHTIIGAGSASGSLDAANMLKPALARGAISIIGATTLEEYKKHIQTDSALERRVQPVFIDEPSIDETRDILRGIKKNYETFHNVVITNGAIDAAVLLSNRYIPEKLQPDKSIDLIDETAARVKVDRSSGSLWQRIKQLEAQLSSALEKKPKNSTTKLLP